MRIRMNKKIGIGAAVTVGTIAVIGAVAKAFDEHGRQSFYKGLDVGKLIGDFTTAENFSHKQAELHRKYDTLQRDYKKLNDEYDELSAEYNDILRYYEGE